MGYRKPFEKITRADPIIPESTIVKHNIEKITRLLVEDDLNHLHYIGWPKEILKFDLSSKSWDMNTCMKECIFDIDNGLILKLGQDKRILAAFRGR